MYNFYIIAVTYATYAVSFQHPKDIYSDKLYYLFIAIQNDNCNQYWLPVNGGITSLYSDLMYISQQLHSYDYILITQPNIIPVQLHCIGVFNCKQNLH